MPDDVPMIPTDARDRGPTKMALLELVQHALIRRLGRGGLIGLRPLAPGSRPRSIRGPAGRASSRPGPAPPVVP